MHATAFLKSPDAPIGPAVVLFGSERFLKQECLAAIATNLLGSEADESASMRFQGKDAELRTVLDTLLTVSLWAKKQLVLVDDADEFVTANRAALEKYLDRPAKKSVLALIVKTWPSTTRLAKRVVQIGLPIDCNGLKPAELTGWLVERCKQRYGRKIERPAVATLIELAGTELGMLDQELAKLAAAVGEKGAIEVELVKGLVGGWKAETTWKMLDAVRDGHVGEAVHLLDKLLSSGEHPLKLLGGINFVYRPIARAVEMSRHGTAIREALIEAGAKPFTIEPTLAYLRRVGRPRAEAISQHLLDADLDLKGRSALHERVIVERLLLQLGGVV